MDPHSEAHGAFGLCHEVPIEKLFQKETKRLEQLYKPHPDGHLH
jgi:hypothetical protein